MVSGIQEILLILFIVLGLFLLPRITSRRQPPTALRGVAVPPFSRSLRLGILLSLIWLAGWAIWLRPWQADLTAFSAIGIGPVALGWGIKWVLAGKKNTR